MQLLVIFVGVLAVSVAVPVDNGLEGVPEIECGATSVTVNFNTKNPFEGHVYVKNEFTEPECRNDAGGRRTAGIALQFDACGVRRERSLNPKGVFVTTTVVISFHPKFLTKVDRAFHVECFYMEATKTVDSDFEVSMLTTAFRSSQVAMPVCKYEILDGSSAGDSVQFAEVGRPVYHKWTCDSETVDIFCMVVHNCIVDDTNGDTVDLIDENGCAMDLNLLNNPEYPSDLIGGIESHVFKYIDRPNLYFQCQITILVKEPNELCPRPACASPASRGAGALNAVRGPPPPAPAHPFPLRPDSPYLPTTPPATNAFVRFLRRRVRRTARAPLATLDVHAELAAIDSPPHDAGFQILRRPRHGTQTASKSIRDVCLSPSTFAVFVGAMVVMVLTVISSTTLLLLRAQKIN